ncbi:MAG: tyrosine-type recombinase/integrase [Candidatus Xenobia bacterium]
MLMADVDRYLCLRRAAGFKLRNTTGMLRAFAAHAEERGEAYVRSQTAIDWASTGSTPRQRDHRIREVNRFARFLRAEDPTHEVPPADVFPCRRSRPSPYIYQSEEIRLLLEFASRLAPKHTIRPHTYRTLFGLLACTGLRLSEALSLRLCDITPTGLTILETKFRKSRFIPLHPTAAAPLAEYLALRQLVDTSEAHVFLSLRLRPLHPDLARYAFHEVCAAAGIPRQGCRRRPRLHDLRHTFAVRALQACNTGRSSAQRHMLALTTYLGHARLEDTYWYLESTPELLSDIASVAEHFIYGGNS